MGRRCDWCQTVLPSHGGACSPASSSICRGCFEELELALARSGLRTARPSASRTPSPTLDAASEIALSRSALSGGVAHAFGRGTA